MYISSFIISIGPIQWMGKMYGKICLTCDWLIGLINQLERRSVRDVIGVTSFNLMLHGI